MKIFAIALVATAALTAAAPQVAAAETPAPSVSVRYTDLDLQKPADAQTLLHRIRMAAVDACQAPAGDKAREIERFDACHHAAVQEAVSRLGAPLVTAAYEDRASLRTYARLR